MASNTTKLNNNKTLSLSAKNTKLFSYVGSKFKYKKHYDSLLTNVKKKEYKVYIEAFAGSLASLFHNLEHIKADKIIINDFNPKIINVYTQIKNNPTEVFEKYLILENEFNRIVPQFILDKYKSKGVKKEDRIYMQEVFDFYLDAKEVYNNLILNTEHAALFIFIMKHCFSGCYKENKQGKLTTGFNWCAKRIDVKVVENAIMNLHNFFKSNNVEFENLDVFELINKYDESDTFIYLDPPYSNSVIQYENGKRSRKKAVDTITFNEIKLHQQLIEMCNSKFECVMYSNNFDEIFIDNFDNHTTFERNNSIGTEKIGKRKLEILAIKTNEIVPVLEKATSVAVLLRLASPIDYNFKVNGLIETNNSDYKASEIASEVA
jgi:site-specific DNA-adenine methylase